MHAASQSATYSRRTRQAFPRALVALLGICLASLLPIARAESDTPEKRHSPAEMASYRPSDFRSPITSTEGERARYAEERAKLLATLTAPTSNEALAGALWTMGLLNTDIEAGRKPLLHALRQLNQQPIETQRALLTAAYTLYPSDASPFIWQLLPKLGSPREFAIAAYLVMRQPLRTRQHQTLLALLNKQLDQQPDEPRLLALAQALSTNAHQTLQKRPPLADLLAAPIRTGFPVIFSFQRHDRQWMGLTMVRGADGRFVRQPDGTYFHSPQLALARTNLPGTITNGNTPQGLFAINGMGTAENSWIGPTPYLHSKLPIEASVGDFEHQRSDDSWSATRYMNYWPTSWQQYPPIQEAWLAGRAGRSEILLHGTTINPDYYRNATYFPGTPSAGCLVSMEYWDKTTGQLVHSDQLALAKAFSRDGLDQGYLVVIELDDRAAAVSLVDVIADVMAAEARLPIP